MGTKVLLRHYQYPWLDETDWLWMNAKAVISREYRPNPACIPTVVLPRHPPCGDGDPFVLEQQITSSSSIPAADFTPRDETRLVCT